MMDLNQKTRWSSGELELIRNTFGGDGEKVLLQIRDVFFQFGSEVPKLSKEVIAVLRKMILPDLDKDLPIGFQADIRNALAGSPDKAGIKDIPPEVAYLQIKANDLVIEYLEQQFEELSGGVQGDLLLEEMKEVGSKTNEERYISMLAYLFLENAYIDGSLNAIKTLANHKEPTKEELEAQAKANSSK